MSAALVKLGGVACIGLAWLLTAACLVAAGIAYIWGILFWFSLAGPVGLLFGLILIPDIVLPFVYHAVEGGWPTLWLLLVAGAFIARLLAGAFEVSGNWLYGESDQRAAELEPADTFQHLQPRPRREDNGPSLFESEREE